MEDNIELVIKLPKGVYVASQMLDVKPDDVVQIPLEIIANGTPLPKGHGKIIDESRITDVYIQTTEKEYINGVLIPPIIKIIGTNATTIIEADNVENEEQGMTREEAAKIIKKWLINGTDGLTKDRLGYIEGWFHKEDAEAFEMAIKVLER